jgi:MFS family permease
MSSWDVLRTPAFRWLVTSQGLAMLADVALTLALGVWINTLTGSAAAAGTVFVFFAFPTMLGPLAGPVIDRFSRRNVLVSANLVLAAAVLSLLTVTTTADVWVINTVAAFYGAGQQVIFAARSSLVPSVVEPAALESGNGLLESLRQSLRVIGPVAGTSVFVAFGGPALALTVAGFLLASTVLLLRVPPDHPTGKHAPGGALHTLTRGLRILWYTPELRRLMRIYVITFGAAGLLEVSMFALVHHGLHQPAGFVGVLATAEGAGSLLAGVTIATLTRRVGLGKTQAAALAAMTAGLALLAFPLGAIIAAAGFALFGLGLVGFLVSYITIIQQRAAPHEHGTAFLAAEAVGNLPFVASLATAAGLLTLVGYRTLLIGSFAALSLATLWVSLFPLLRRRTQPADPPVPEVGWPSWSRTTDSPS